MDLATLIAAVAAFGLPCSNPELRDYPAEELPWPAAYIRSIEGHNIIALRQGIRNDTQRLPKIIVHELLHCGLYEAQERREQPHSRSLDPREEMAVIEMTDMVLGRLHKTGRG
ncbi:MAG TPA: hypothetical protein VGQ19_19175 [Burkholderiales bacterium]|nr:hypothetical protein [Burkholderiales bacterium]